MGTQAHEIDDRQFEPAAGPRNRRLYGNPADRRAGPPLRRRGDLRRDPGERPRRGCVRAPVDRLSGQRQSDGIADHDRCAQTRVGTADHRGHALFRLCATGSQTRPAHADLGEAGRQPDHRRGRRPRPVGRPARRADPGLLRYPDRQSLCRAGHVGGHQCAVQGAEPDGRVPRRRRRRARARARQATRQRAARDRRQAPRARGRIRR